MLTFTNEHEEAAYYRRYLPLLRKWQKHFQDLGCGHDKVYRLSRKHADREMRQQLRQK